MTGRCSVFSFLSILWMELSNKMECYSITMIFYRRNTQRILDKALGIFFETFSFETNLAICDLRQLISCLNT